MSTLAHPSLIPFSVTLEDNGWVRYSGGDLHAPGLSSVSWTHRLLPLRVWSFADRSGVREHVLAARAPKGAGWVWRASMPEPDNITALTAIGRAVGCLEQGHAADTGAVFLALTGDGWGIDCGTDPDEPSYGAVAPDGMRILHLPDSPVDPGMWVVTRTDGVQMAASAATPVCVVVALAGL
jgi:hypothetical protein